MALILKSFVTFCTQHCMSLYGHFEAMFFSFQFPLVLLIAIAMFFANVVTPSGKCSNSWPVTEYMYKMHFNISIKHVCVCTVIHLTYPNGSFFLVSELYNEGSILI
jgi:hypothetical protein